MSTPLTWHEVEDATRHRDARRLRFLTDQALDRVEERGDLFAPMLDLQQSLPVLI